VAGRRQQLGYAVAVGGPLLLSIAVVPLRDTVAAGALALVLVLPVVAASVLAGRGGGIVAALCATACFDVFLTRPYGSFTIDAGDDLVTTGVLLLVGLTVSGLVVAKERSDRMADERGREVRSMRRVAGVGAGGDDPGWLISAAGNELVELLDADTVEYVPGAPPADLPRLGHGKVVVPATSAGPDVTDDRWVVLPVERSGEALAHFRIELPTRARLYSLSSTDRARAVAIADLLGGALARTSRPSPN
jgi:K+-sensing histidine kinase KdpD